MTVQQWHTAVDIRWWKARLFFWIKV